MHAVPLYEFSQGLGLKHYSVTDLYVIVMGGAKLDHCGGVKVDQLNM